MSSSTAGLEPALAAYVTELATHREPPLLAELRRETAQLPDARMQISPEQGRFMRLLARLSGAKRALEVGVFTGYSSLCVALALPEDGELIACDLSEEWTAMARRYWERAGVAERVQLKLAPAGETLAGLIAAGQQDSFDFAFVDADKQGYDGYYEQCLQLLRPGGLLALDNAFMGGRVADPNSDAAGRHVDALNRKAHQDERVDASLLPVGDGLLLVRKR